MRFENLDYTARTKFSRLIVMVLTGVAIVCLLMLIKSVLVSALASAGVVLIYVLYNVYRFKLQLNYIFYCDEWNTITLRFYHIVTFSKKYRTYEITTDAFYKYEIEQNKGRKFLVLYKREGNKILKFPSVCISSLRDDEILSITNSLDSLKKH